MHGGTLVRVNGSGLLGGAAGGAEALATSVVACRFGVAGRASPHTAHAAAHATATMSKRPREEFSRSCIAFDIVCYVLVRLAIRAMHSLGPIRKRELALEQCQTYEDWLAAAKEADAEEGRDVWRAQLASASERAQRSTSKDVRSG